MEITGYRLREALKQWGLRKATAEESFATSLHKFEGDTKDSPVVVAENLLKAEETIAKLQVAQMRYNLAVIVDVEGLGTTTLAEAIKLVRSAELVEKLWRAANVTPKRNRYDSSPELVRDPTQIRAVATISQKDVLVQTSTAARRSGALRSAIALGNAWKVPIENLSPELFE